MEHDEHRHIEKREIERPISKREKGEETDIKDEREKGDRDRREKGR